ncbi:MAG TPA: lipid-binding SYLF domain-containing protein [Woeseiaceae bacterium]|nr:lipid-binding SYLF domain-containing protein [Woeseiaceae bacterium]
MTLVRLVSLIALLATGSPALSNWEAREGDKTEAKAAIAIEKLHDRMPQTQSYLDQAYAFAIYPSVTRIGFGFGGALGKGVVIEGEKTIGKSSYRQFSSGVQAGARNFTMILFFKDKSALELFQAGKVHLMGQAGLAIGPVGVAGTPGYNDGVAVITMTRFGLMAEFSISGAKFTYKPTATHRETATSPDRVADDHALRSGR